MTVAGAKLIRSVLMVLVAPFLVMVAGFAAAQTAEQLEIFRNLSPEQQRAVLEQMEGQGAAGTSARGQPLEFPATSRPRNGGETAVAELEQEPRFRASDSLILGIEIKELPESSARRDPGVERALKELLSRVAAGNPYRLDRTGVLSLPGGTRITLAGLTVEQATQRLNTEPSLLDFEFEVSLLPVEPELKPFGYDMFDSVPTTFAPATDIPVPAEYVLGPGDTLEVQLIGNGGGRYSLTVGRDGAVDFPELGPIGVAGMRFAAAKEMLERRVSEQMIGARASVSIGALRSIQVFVAGEAIQPGSYTVSGLSTITNALFTSGGVTPVGSLRNIQLKRNGQVVSRLDLYDLLLNGDTRNDARLLPGDVIFIPPVGVTAAVTGEVRRPAIYELPEGSPASQLLYLSGGLTPEADPRTARLERIDERRNRTVVDLDLTTPLGRASAVQTGDLLRIQAIRDSFEGAVTLVGHVHRPGGVQYRPGMRLTDLVGSLDEVKPLADLHYVLIRRETGPDRRVSVVSTDLARAFAEPASAYNVALEARDRVFVFDLATSRERVVGPIIADLERQSDRDEPLQMATVGGRVKVPGRYPLEPGMTVSDLLRAGGGLDQAAYGGEAELTRYEVIDGARRQTERVDLNLERILAGESTADVVLRPFDYVVIKETPLWGEEESVTIEGEVLFPGTYPIQRGETLRSVLARAGGFTDLAFPAGGVFTREFLREREQRQLEVLAERLRRELAALSLQQAQTPEAASTAQAMAAGQSLLADLQATEAVGRLVIDLEKVVQAEPGAHDDIVVKNGDRLFVPRQTQEVTVLGEVQSPTSHLYQASLTRDDYVQRSGGTTQRADKKRIYVVRANGMVELGRGSGWFARSGDMEIRPGDTVIVPLDAQQVRPLTLWTSVTQILYNIAVAVAAVNSF